MKISEFVCSLLLLSLSVSIVSSSIIPFSKLIKQYDALNHEYTRDRFIAESFYSMCCDKEKTEAEFDEWGKMCSSIFKLKLLSVEKTGGEQKLKCSWSTARGIKVMICRKEF